ncbi:MAG TPA: gamma-glutamyltransferase [Steroidobacteraceae bacterium]|nr:gamma-glutamyltransferase [Steroidobacteraceae bacterium]
MSKVPRIESPHVSRRAFNGGMLGLAGLGATSAVSLSIDTAVAGSSPASAAGAPPVQKYPWTWHRARPGSYHGRNGMVASSRGGKPMEDAVTLLKQGGNAMDAALSMTVAQVTYALGNWVTMAGLFTMAYYEASSGRVYSMNAGYNTVQNERDPLTIPPSSLVVKSAPDLVTSGRAVLVPGFFAGIQAAHARFGSVPFTKLFDSSLAIANNGVYVTPDLVEYLTKHRGHFSRLPETKAVFTKRDGTHYKEGDLFLQPALAKTLQAVAQQGADYIYKGPWGKKFIAGVQADGGKMTMQDLADYRVEWAEPIHMRYKGYDVYSHHQAHSMLGMLGLAQAGDLASLGRYYESPEAFYWFHKIFRATGTNMQMIGERINHLAVPAQDWLDPAKVAKYWQQLRAGTFPTVSRSKVPQHSDCIAVIDKAGNVVALTHSTNSGSTGLFVDGISVPAPAANQQPGILKAGPGKRLPNFIPNTIVLKDGKPVIATSAIGMALHQETVKVLTNVIDYGTSGRNAVEAPSFVEPAMDMSGADDAETVLTGDYGHEILDAARARGMQINELPYAPVEPVKSCIKTARPGTGSVTAIVVDGKSGEYEGVSPRFVGSALGY